MRAHASQVSLAAKLGAAVVLVLALASLAASSRAASSGLVAAYSFNAGTGTTVKDDSGTGNTGTISNATWTTGGKYGGALSFNGSNSWVTVPNTSSLDFTSGMTLEGWVKPTALGSSWRAVVVKERPGFLDYALYAHDGGPGPSGHVYVGGRDQYMSGNAVAANTWTHLAATYNGSAVKLYVNGALATTRNVTGPISTSGGALRIGGDSVWSEWFAGLIDEVRVYNRALTPAEISTDMTTPIQGAAADTQAPSTPTGLAVSATAQTSVTVKWNASTDNVGVTGYGRYLNNSLVTNTTGTSYTFTGLTCSKSYTFAVDAYDAAGNRSGKASLTASTAACSTGDTQAPTSPTNLAAGTKTTTSIAVSWTASTDNVGVTGYGRYLNNSLVINTTGTSYTFTGLKCATSYTLAVDAYDAAGNRSGKATVTASTSACSDTQAPSAPTGLTAGTATATSIPVSWTASTDNVGVTGYGRYLNNSLVINTTGTSYTFTGLTCGTSYTLAVDAYDAVGNRSAKTQISAATSACQTGGASVFISPSGADSNPCSQSQPCKSFNRAYHAAAQGATVQVAGGSYGGETISSDSSKTSSADVLFVPASGASVTVTGQLNVAAAHIEFRNMSLLDLDFQRQADDVTVRNVINHGVWMEGPSNISIIGGEITCGFCDSHPILQNGGSDQAPPRNILFDGVNFHDWQSVSGEHTECLQILGGDGITIRNSIFKNCGTANNGLGSTADLFIGYLPGSGAVTKNVLIENNFLYPAGNPYVIQMSDLANTDLRYNSFAGPIIIFDREGPGTGMDFVGNILKYDRCTAENNGVPINWRYNVIQGGTCGSTDKNAAAGFIDPNNNLHLASGSAARNAGDPSSYPSTDIDGQARPMGGAPDAGADEAG